MKKRSLLALTIMAFALTFTACSQKEAPAADNTTVQNDNATNTESNNEESNNEENSTANTEASSGDIHVISREDGSGTRGAFVEITEILSKNENREKVDNTTIDAIIQNCTDAVMTTVAGDKDAIGYISLGSLNDTVKAVNVNDVEPTVDNVKSGKYPLQRPFLIAYKSLNPTTEDFIKYIMSSDAKEIIEQNGYVSSAGEEKYTVQNLSGSIVISGSTSVTPLMEKLIEAYNVFNPDVDIELQSTGSSAGIADVTNDAADLAMSSRNLKDEEKLESQTMAIDGIAVIVHKDNALSNISMEQLKQIYIGELTDWSGLEK